MATHAGVSYLRLSMARPSIKGCSEDRPERMTWLILVGVPLLFATASFGRVDQFRFSSCTFRTLTGVPCPGCGLTRSLCLVARGDWSASLQIHPLGILIAAAALGIWLLCVAVSLRAVPHQGHPAWPVVAR